MDDQAALLKDIEAFITAQNMAETTFGLRAANDGKLVERLRSNTITMKTARRIREFMAGYAGKEVA